MSDADFRQAVKYLLLTSAANDLNKMGAQKASDELVRVKCDVELPLSLMVVFSAMTPEGENKQTTTPEQVLYPLVYAGLLDFRNVIKDGFKRTNKLPEFEKALKEAREFIEKQKKEMKDAGKTCSKIRI